MNKHLGLPLAGVLLLFAGIALAQTPAPNPVPALPAIAPDAAALPVSIAPTDPKIHYDGRFDRTDPKGPRCTWPASALVLKFRGTALNVVLGDTDNDGYQVIVDGSPAGVLTTQDGSHVYRVADSLSRGVHTVTLIRRTESFVGTSQFTGFQLAAGGQLLSAPAPKRRIEVVGDSISCGYGDEAPGRDVHFTPATENAALTYGELTAQAVGADYADIAWSGRKMWPDNTMDSIYGQALATDAKTQWDFALWTPQVVVICLATNDFGQGPPDAQGWIKGYEAFIARVRTHYPKARIYCASSPMMAGDNDTIARADLATIIADEHKAGDTNIAFLDFPTQQDSDGYGADWHPSLATHRRMAGILETALQHDLGWKPTTK